MIRINLDDRQVRKALGQLIRRLQDPRPALDEVGHAVKSNVDLTFRTGTSPYGVPWAPLSAVTKSRRRRGSDKPLRDTGILANSISYNVLRKGVEIGTKVRYAGTHQFGARQGQYGRTKRGGPIPWGNIPARPFLPTDGLPPEWVISRSPGPWRGILSILSRYLSRYLG